MKLTPKQYAQGLIEVLEQETDLNVIAKKLWKLLQRNKQQKDLKKILAAIDLEYAKKQGKELASIYSNRRLSNAEKTEAKKRIEKNIGGEVIVKEIVKSDLSAGIIVKVGDKEIDLSVDSRIARLRKQLMT